MFIILLFRLFVKYAFKNQKRQQQKNYKMWIFSLLYLNKKN